MNISKHWKFLPIGVFVALLALLAGPGGLGSIPVQANVTGVAIDDTELVSGGETEVTVTATAGIQSVIITAEGTEAGTVAELTVTDCNPNCPLEEGESDDTINIGLDNVLQITLTLSITCEVNDTITITATQNAVAEDDTIDCLAPNITIIKDAGTDTATEFNFTITGPGTECDDSFSLINDGQAGYICETGSFVVTETAQTGWVVTAINCEEDGADTTVVLADRKVTIALGSGDSAICTFVNSNATPTVGTASSVTLSPAPNSVGCNGGSLISITVKDSGGIAVASGTAVTVNASIGSVTPTSATTGQGGSLVVLYTAPASSGGTATITATAGTAVGQTQIAVSCSAAATPVPPPPPPPATGGSISPPNTGDAGLATTSSSNGLLAVIVLLSSLAGAYAVVRARA